MVVAQEASGVEWVAKTADTHSDLDAENVGEGAGEEGDDGEDGIQSGGGVVLDGGVDLAAATEAAKGVIHAGAQKAHHGKDQQLDLGRRVPNILAVPAIQLLVHPSLWAIDRIRIDAHAGGANGLLLRGDNSLLVRHFAVCSCLVSCFHLPSSLLGCPQIQ